MVIRWTCPFFATCKVLLELQEETPQADIDQDNVSLAGVLQGAVGRAVDTPVFALLLDDNTRFSHDRRRGRGMQSGRVWTRLDAVFPILQRLVHADFAAVEIGFYAQCWSCFSELDVGWLEPFLFIFNRKANYGNHKLELTSHCLTSDWQLKDCDTFCSMAYIFKWHLNNIRKWLGPLFLETH